MGEEISEEELGASLMVIMEMCLIFPSFFFSSLFTVESLSATSGPVARLLILAHKCLVLFVLHPTRVLSCPAPCNSISCCPLRMFLLHSGLLLDTLVNQFAWRTVASPASCEVHIVYFELNFHTEKANLRQAPGYTAKEWQSWLVFHS